MSCFKNSIWSKGLITFSLSYRIHCHGGEKVDFSSPGLICVHGIMDTISRKKISFHLWKNMSPPFFLFIVYQHKNNEIPLPENY